MIFRHNREIRVLKSRRIKWARHVARMVEGINM